MRLHADAGRGARPAVRRAASAARAASAHACGAAASDACMAFRELQHLCRFVLNQSLHWLRADQHISADDPAARHTTQRAAVVECKAPGTQDSGKRPLLFFALAGRVPLFSCRQANVPTNMRRKESEKRHRVRSEDDRKRALRLLLCQSRCCNRLKRDAEAVCTHWVAQRMTTAASSSCS